ncbi:MAG: zinc-ribbon domain-containing protein [Terriglobales bacterium]|jgi:hypothetical protein
MKFCTRCGRQLEETNAQFCSNCGSPVIGSKSPRVPEPARSSSGSAVSSSGEARSELVRTIARCSKTKAPFGLRIERIGEGKFKILSIFEISEERARSSAFENTQIHGVVGRGEEYAGCPKCGAGDLGVTPCRGCRIVCKNKSDTVFTCPWCGEQHGCGEEVFDGDLSGGIDK